MRLRAVPGGKSETPTGPTSPNLRDLDAEREVLACAMLVEAHEAARLLALVPDGAWAIERHRAIAQAMREVANEGLFVEPIALSIAMREHGTWEINGGMRCISEILDRAGTVPNGAHYARKVVARWQLRRVYEAGGHMSVQAEQGDDPADVIAQCRALLDEASVGVEVEATEAERVEAMLERIRNPTTRKVYSTGLPSLDAKLDGGLRGGHLIVVLAPPKQGKTALVLNNLGHAALAAGERLAIFGEMSEDEIMERWLAKESGVPSRAQRTGDLTSWQWSSVAGAADRMAQWRWVCRDIGPVDRICEQARALKSSTAGLGMVVVDYLQLVSNGQENRTLDLEHTTRSLKLLARELDVPVIAVSQPGAADARAKSELGLHDGKGSSSIASDCDLMLVPLRDAQDPTKAGLSAPGYRHGAAFRLELGALRFNGGKMAFEEA